MVSIKGLGKAKVLAALYNASHPQGMGFLQYRRLRLCSISAATFLLTT